MSSVSFSRPLGSTRSRISWVPGSSNGIRPSPTVSRRPLSLSTPITSTPRSAKDSASGNPIRPSPTIAALCVMPGRLPATLAPKLPGEREHEAGVVVEVAREKPSRLLGDPVGPLETAVLHPGRGLRDAAGVEVEGGADGSHDRDVELLAHAGHPLLLLRHTDSDPEHVRLRAVDLLGDRVL